MAHKNSAETQVTLNLQHQLKTQFIIRFPKNFPTLKGIPSYWQILPITQHNCTINRNECPQKFGHDKNKSSTRRPSCAEDVQNYIQNSI
jgi:hypothetical protein